GDSFHPELGHMIVSAEGETCYCGHKGCFERLWSGTALHKRAKDLGFDDFNQLFDRWKSGDEGAATFIRQIRLELQTAVWNLGIVFKPDIVILGGGIMHSYFSFASDALLADMQKNIDFVPPYEVLQADPEHNPALIGAMRLFQSH
ncbi:MAG: ROK family protein, partial [Hungatella sp.]